MPDGTDPREFLAPNITIDGWGVGSGEVAPPGWEVELGAMRIFRVRGFSWFKKDVTPNVSDLAPLIPAMQAKFIPEPADQPPALPGWTALKTFRWAEAFAMRQVYDAAGSDPSKRLLQFAKAAKVLLLCEMKAAEVGVTAETLYQHMRLEPACFGISDFTRQTLQAAERDREDIVSVLRRETAQESQGVFWDMADGKWVTYRLATQVRRILKKELPKLRIGEVVIPLNGRRTPSPNERIDGDSIPDAA